MAPLIHPPGKHIDLLTGTFPIPEWGPECTRRFVSDERFAHGRECVIRRTSRAVTLAAIEQNLGRSTPSAGCGLGGSGPAAAAGTGD
jgi:hypothetical protein